MKDKKDEDSTFSIAAKVIGVAGAIGAAVGLISWMSSGSERRKRQRR